MINACIFLASLGASTADGCCMVAAQFGLALSQYMLRLFECGVQKLPYDKVRRTKAGHYAVLSSTCCFIFMKFFLIRLFSLFLFYFSTPRLSRVEMMGEMLSWKGVIRRSELEIVRLNSGFREMRSSELI